MGFLSKLMKVIKSKPQSVVTESIDDSSGYTGGMIWDFDDMGNIPENFPEFTTNQIPTPFQSSPIPGFNSIPLPSQIPESLSSIDDSFVKNNSDFIIPPLPDLKPFPTTPMPSNMNINLDDTSSLEMAVAQMRGKDAPRKFEHFHPISAFIDKRSLNNYNEVYNSTRENAIKIKQMVEAEAFKNQEAGHYQPGYKGSKEYMEIENSIVANNSTQNNFSPKEINSRIKKNNELLDKIREEEGSTQQPQKTRKRREADEPKKEAETTKSLEQPTSVVETPPELREGDYHPDTAFIHDKDDLYKYNLLTKPTATKEQGVNKNLTIYDRDRLSITRDQEDRIFQTIEDNKKNLNFAPSYSEEAKQRNSQRYMEAVAKQKAAQGPAVDIAPSAPITTPEQPITTPPPVKQETKEITVNQTSKESPPSQLSEQEIIKKRFESHQARIKSNPNYASLNKLDPSNLNVDSDGSIARKAFDSAVGNKKGTEIGMLREELIGAARNENPETVNQRIDFYKNQGTIDDKEAEPLKAFFNSNFDDMDEQGLQGWFKQYNDNLNKEMTPRQARLSVNQEMNNKKEGFFSSNSEDNFRNFAGRAIAGGMLGAAIGSATDDNPEAGFVAGVVGASAGKNIAGMLRNNTDMFEGKMINSLLKDTAKGKTRPQQLEAVEELDDEALDFMDKMYKDKLTNNFGTKNMFENSALTSSRSMTLGGAALAGVAFTPKKRDHRRGFNANRGNRI